MDVLVLGGTRFIGHAIVEAALRSGHELTLCNRGSNPGVFPQVERIRADRDRAAGMARIGGRRWDAVVDLSGYRPAQVRPVLDALGGAMPHYVYISTVSVYALPLAPGAGETAPLLQVDESIPSSDPRSYGGLKALSEELLHYRAADALTIVRPTIVIGPRDYTDRFGWWVRRVAGGRVPEPPRSEQPLQLIDVRDLASFIVRCIEERIFGTYNAVGPEEPLTLRSMIETVAAALQVTASTAPAADGGRLPLVIDDPVDDGVFQVSGAGAYRQGLSLTPLAESARDVLRWEGARSG